MIYQASRLDEYTKVLAWLFTLSFIQITFLPRSIDDTMFMDGVTYASIARNMSIGIGSFWRPFFANSFWLPYDNHGFFSGHPPLQFGIQALMFRVMGDSIAVENIYNFIILATSIFLIVKIWCLLLTDKPDLRRFSWLPVLCWYAIAIVWYSIPNNFLDSTMAVFCLLSCYFQILFFKNRSGFRISYLLLAGICIVLGFLTKGPVSLFPLAFPLIYTLSSNKKQLQRAVIYIAIMASVFFISFLIILSYQPASDFLNTYIHDQVVQALLQRREKTGTGIAGHLYLLSELLRNVYPHLLTLVVLNAIIALSGLKAAISKEVWRAALIFFLTATSATLPMLISIKQYPHYLLPSLPFVALLFAALYVEKLKVVFDTNKRVILVGLILASASCWGLTIFKINHAEPSIMAGNAIKIRSLVKRSSTIGVCHDLFQNADIHANFQRYHFLSLTMNIATCKYIFADSACLTQFHAKTDSFIPLKGNYLLVIRNAHHAAIKPLARKSVKITSPDS